MTRPRKKIIISAHLLQALKGGRGQRRSHLICSEVNDTTTTSTHRSGGNFAGEMLNPPDQTAGSEHRGHSLLVAPIPPPWPDHALGPLFINHLFAFSRGKTAQRMGSRQDALSLEGLLSVELIDRVGLTWRQKREGRRRTHAGETRRVQEGILEWKEVSHGTVYYTHDVDAIFNVAAHRGQVKTTAKQWDGVLETFPSESDCTILQKGPRFEYEWASFGRGGLTPRQVVSRFSSDKIAEILFWYRLLRQKMLHRGIFRGKRKSGMQPTCMCYFCCGTVYICGLEFRAWHFSKIPPPEKHHVQREEIKDVYQAQDEEILLGHLQAGDFEIPAACRDVKKALALKVSPTSNGEPICSEPWFYHTSQLGSVPFLGQPAIPHVAVRRRAPLRPIRTSPPGTRISSPLAHFRRDVSAISNNHFNSSRVELSIRTFTRNNIACVFAEFGNADRISTFCVRRVKFVMRAARPKKANCAKVTLKWRLRRNTADGLDFVALNFTVDFDK
ncbi:hypothetical protein GEV33_009119 [Tenebrio molitor]|uniref:Uncharacterized protein n=1 Tax=Tenebrio molitor TaxID=7067 RepID=A0A8J6HGE1_TENMO|nr:hypothetical protein GEV33_009119 [Tenebrio molitor]